MRGLATALVEHADFASGTSSRSSKLIHGGFRYLEHGEVRLVLEGVRERGRLRRVAPPPRQPPGVRLPRYPRPPGRPPEPPPRARAPPPPPRPPNRSPPPNAPAR